MAIKEIFNNGKIKVRVNHTDELFIEDVKSGAEIRLNSDGGKGLVFTVQNELVEPTKVNGMIGWSIRPR